jgi:hypothetical protein
MNLTKAQKALSILKREMILNPNDADRLLEVFMKGVYTLAYKDGFSDGTDNARFNNDLNWLLERQEK